MHINSLIYTYCLVRTQENLKGFAKAGHNCCFPFPCAAGCWPFHKAVLIRPGAGASFTTFCSSRLHFTGRAPFAKSPCPWVWILNILCARPLSGSLPLPLSGCCLIFTRAPVLPLATDTGRPAWLACSVVQAIDGRAWQH